MWINLDWYDILKLPIVAFSLPEIRKLLLPIAISGASPGSLIEYGLSVLCHSPILIAGPVLPNSCPIKIGLATIWLVLNIGIFIPLKRALAPGSSLVILPSLNDK